MLTCVTLSVPPCMPLCPDMPVDPLVEPLALEPVEPVEPVAPDEPVELVVPVEPVVPVDPVEPAVPVEPDVLGDDELLIADPLAEPPNRPVTVTWWPTCCARFTELSAVRRRSCEPRPLMLPLRPAVDGDDEDADDSLPADELAPDALEAVEPEDDAPVPDIEPVEPEPPIRAFFSTNEPPLPPLADEAPLVALVLELELVLDASARCRQPVAVTVPADSDAERPVVPCPLWGVVDVGDWAASAPQNAKLLQRVIAHCQ